MATEPIQFGGEFIGRPGAFSVVDSSRMVPAGAPGKSLGFIGVAPALKEGLSVATPLTYTAQKAKQAIADIGAGDLLDNMQIAWAHGANAITVSVVSKTATTQTPATDEEWQTAIDILATEYVDGIVAITTESAILTKIKEHVITCSSVKTKKERRAFYGHKAGMAKEAVVQAVTPIAHERMVLASPAVYTTKADGTKQLRTSVELASAYAGIWSSKESQDPLTYDYVKFAGLEKQYTADEVEELIEGGVMICELVKGGGIRIVQAVTTSQSKNEKEIELSVSTVADTVSIEMREFMENTHVGKAGIAGIDTTIYNDAVSLIESFKKRNLIESYVKESVTVNRNGKAFWIDWEGKPVLPINNFLITTYFTL